MNLFTVMTLCILNQEKTGCESYYQWIIGNPTPVVRTMRNEENLVECGKKKKILEKEFLYDPANNGFVIRCEQSTDPETVEAFAGI